MKKITFFLSALMLMTFAGCSSDNEPTPENSGRDEYNLLLGTITTSGGDIAFQSLSEDASVKGMVVCNEAESKQFCEVLLHSSWDGKNTTRTLPDGYGSFSIVKSEEAGVFHTVNFNIKGYAPFTLKLATAEYFNNDNFAISSGGFKGTRYWKCKVCGYMLNADHGVPHPCPSCKNDRADQWTSVMSGSAPLI